MTSVLVVNHDHTPVYRVIRKKWKEPLDVSYSQKAADNRWNTPEFPALYCSCSLQTARAVTRHLFAVRAQTRELPRSLVPNLVEIAWAGKVVDVASAEGVLGAGFDSSYPKRSDKERTRQLATEWHSQGAQGVVCRSASLAQRRFSNWTGPHEQWSELAIFVGNCDDPPVVRKRRSDLDWLRMT
jgi:RES domain-containing protein